MVMIIRRKKNLPTLRYKKVGIQLDSTTFVWAHISLAQPHFSEIYWIFLYLYLYLPDLHL